MTDSLGLNYELTQFSGEAPIFPLPETVFFPKTLLPLHIFEERYKQMTEEVLAGERIICIALLREGWEEEYLQDPPIYHTGTIGYLEDFTRLEEGKFNILLNGLAKVNITEMPSDRMYRRGEMRVIQDSSMSGNPQEEREKLLRQFRQVAEATDSDFPLEEVEQSNISLEVLVNLVTTWLPISVADKQKLLEINDLAIRSEIVREYLRQELEDLTSMDNLDFIIPDNPRWN
ncbi:MAG: Lon protease 2 [Candidatus Marinimicrobia bacterium]|nr:Lon protease 2 [Candidatus Neomarinimicrobiota bacterium]